MPPRIPPPNRRMELKACTGLSLSPEALFLQPRVWLLVHQLPLASPSLQLVVRCNQGSSRNRNLRKLPHPRPLIVSYSQSRRLERVSSFCPRKKIWLTSVDFSGSISKGVKSESTGTGTPQPNYYSKSGFDVMGILVCHLCQQLLHCVSKQCYTRNLD